MTKGRRLRLDRRKAGLSQAELAARLDCTVEEISAMERDKLELSPEAAAFSASIPARQPRPRAKAAPPPEAPETAPDEPELPEVEEQREGPGPRVEVLPGADKPPRAGQPPRQVLPARSEIAELEDALLKMFAGERLIVPKQTPDGVVQVEAVIPGIAQVVSMYDVFDGQIIETYSPGMAKAWAELARVNPGVRRVLMGLTYGGAYRGVLAASLPPLLAILAHHGALGQFGGGGGEVQAPPPEPEPQQAAEWNGGVQPGTEALFDSEVG